MRFEQIWAGIIDLPMELFSSRKLKLDQQKQKAICVYVKAKKIMQHMHGIIP